MSQSTSGRFYFTIFVIIIFTIYWLLITPLLFLSVKDRYNQHPDKFYENWKLTFWLIALIVFIVVLLIPAIIALWCCNVKQKKQLDKTYFCDVVIKEPVKDVKPKPVIRKQLIIPKTTDVEIIQMEQVPQQKSPSEQIELRNHNELIKRPLRAKKVTSFEISTQTDEEYGIYRSLRSPITPKEQFFFSNRYSASARSPSLSDSTFCNYNLTPKEEPNKAHSKLIKDEELLKTNKDLFNFMNKKPISHKSIEDFLRNERKFSEIPILKKKFFIANVSPRQTLKSEIFLCVEEDVTQQRQKSLKIAEIINSGNVTFEDDVFE